MRKRILFGLMFVMLGVFLAACSKDPVKHTVTFNSNGGSEVTSRQVDDNALVSRPTDPTKENNTFDGWYKEAALTNDWKFAVDKVTGDITLYAKWTEDVVTPPVEDVTVTFNLNYQGASAPVKVTVKKGSLVEVPKNITRPDFKLTGWSTSASENVPFDLTKNVNASITVYAVWESTLETVEVVIDPNNDGATTKINAVVGQLLEEQPTPVNGDLLFLGWFNGDVEWNFATDKVTVAMTLKAKWLEETREGTAITTPEELIEFINSKSEIGDVYYLVKDIDMAGFTVPYNKDAALGAEFDGQGFTIKNFVREGNGRFALFTTIKGGSVKNLVLENFDINSTGDRAAILAAEIPKGFDVAKISNIVIKDSKVHGSATGQSAGSLVAYVDGPVEINNITVTNVEVSASNTGAGGLIGHLRDDRVTAEVPTDLVSAVIKDIFIDAKVSGTQRVGGVFGQMNAKLGVVTIENVVAVTELHSTGQNLGSVIGKADGKIPVPVMMKNVVAIATYSGDATTNVGVVLGDGNNSRFVHTNVYAYVEGLDVQQTNNLGNNYITNIHDMYDATWWTTNVKDLTESELWTLDSASGLYVMGNSTFVKPTHNVVTFDFGYDNLKLVVSIKVGGAANAPALVREGFTLLGWKLDGADFDLETIVSENITLVANWLDDTLLEEFTVTFDSNGGSAVEEQLVTQNDPAVKPADPTREGFGFLGWYIGEDKYDFTQPVLGDLTLVAKWEDLSLVNFYTVTFDTVDGSSIDPVEVREGFTVNEPDVPAKSGFKFLGWKLGEENYDFGQTVTEDITLVAQWEELDELNVTYELVGLDNKDEYFTTSSGKITEMELGPITYAGYEISETLKFDSNGYFEFTTSARATITIVVKERKVKDYGKGTMKYTINSKTINLPKLENNGDNYVVIELELTEIGKYKFERGGTEQGIYYVSVTEHFE